MSKRTKLLQSRWYLLSKNLHTLYPNYNMGRHIATALDGYGDMWGMTDKEFVYALTKYKVRWRWMFLIQTMLNRSDYKGRNGP